MKLTDPLSAAHAIKLASLAVHAEEFLDMKSSGDARAAQFDEAAMLSLLHDPQVRELLDDPSNRALLPEKRSLTSEDPETRPCPACGARLREDETHWSLYPEPMGGYVCPVPS
jgi:hypothetical protein